MLDGNIAFDFAAPGEDASADATVTNEPAQQPGKKRKCAAKSAAAAEVPAGAAVPVADDCDDTEGLRTRLAALEAENERLRKRAKLDKVDEKKEARRQRREQAKAKRVAAKVARAAERQRTAEEAAASQAREECQRRVDVSAWDRFELHEQLMRVLAASGFGEPTPVQQECLLPAIKGRCDVIGAAQTVRVGGWALQRAACFAFCPPPRAGA